MSIVPYTRPRCHPVDASMQCGARRQAQRDGEMQWNEKAPGTDGKGGWVFPCRS